LALPLSRIALGRARWHFADKQISANAALSARAEEIVKAGGNLDEENVRQTTSFAMIAGFPDMKL